MEKNVLKKLLNEIKEGIELNKKELDEALKEEMSKGNPVNLNRINQMLKEYETMDEVLESEDTTIAVCYSGKPEITMTYILDSIIYNNKVTLCVNEYNVVNEILVRIVVESLRQIGIFNNWIDFDSKYNEIYLRDNQNKYEEIVYIGDFFEYQRFQGFFKKEVEYNNYGYIKLFIDKNKFAKEYEKIVKYAYLENISLEVYNDPDDFISESREEDYSIIMADMEEVNKIKRALRCGELLINAFPYENYKFEISRE